MSANELTDEELAVEDVNQKSKQTIGDLSRLTDALVQIADLHPHRSAEWLRLLGTATVFAQNALSDLDLAKMIIARPFAGNPAEATK